MVPRSLLFLASAACALGFRADVTPPTHLRVEGLLAAEAVLSEAAPRFSFEHPQAAAGQRGLHQASYRITVADADAETSDAADAAAPLWDSGDVASAACSQIVYNGPPLSPFTRYIWTAQWTSDAAGAARSAAETGRFETGPMADADWRDASWSAGRTQTQLRLGNITVPATSTGGAAAEIAYARVYVASPGCHVLEVNGAVPAPDLRGVCPWVVQENTQRNTRYQTHDITSLLHAPGQPNALGLLLGQVMSTANEAIVLVMVRLAAAGGAPGHEHFWSSSADTAGWTARRSYYSRADAWGAALDWTAVEPGWSSPGFVPSGSVDAWSVAQFQGPAVAVTPTPAPTPARWVNATNENAVFGRATAGGTRGDVFYAGTYASFDACSAAVFADANRTGPYHSYAWHSPGFNKGQRSPFDGQCFGVAGWEWQPRAQNGTFSAHSTAPPPPTPPAPAAHPPPLRALMMPRTTVVSEVQPSAVRSVGGSRFLYTFPRNFVGTVRVAPLPGAPAGATLSLQLGEWLTSTGAPGPPTPDPSRCGVVREGDHLELGGCAGGNTISEVLFASFGTPTGSCAAGTLAVDSACCANGSRAVVEEACLGKAACSVPATVATFGDPCGGTLKRLAVRVRCANDPPPTPPAPTPPTPPPTPSPPIFPAISGGRQQFETHTLRAGNAAPLEVRFCWHGFQYVLVTDPGGKAGFMGALGDIVGLETRTDLAITGTLAFGGDGVAGSASEGAADVLRGIDSMTRGSHTSNVAAYMPTDCPTREKHGWMGDAMDASEEGLYVRSLATDSCFLVLLIAHD
jgi:hypothetical protein